MGNLGMPEILMILVIALIIFGPRKLPELGKSLGHGLAQFRKASDDFKRQWEDEVETEKRRLDAAPTVEAARHNEAAAEASAAAASSEPVTSAASAEAYTPGETIHAPVPTVEAASVPRSEATVNETKRDWM
ncbi:MAG TPA: twin-arginine translocase TatA/TatE family subunit [Blastocatellia bacterium]|nr:twin-arginine translocase TatA/TatE family subunit [Blastocatellia bacterium]